MFRRCLPNKVVALFMMVALFAASCQSEASEQSAWCERLAKLADEGQSVAEESYPDIDALRAAAEGEQSERFVAFVNNAGAGSEFLSPAGAAAVDRLLVVAAELSASLPSDDPIEAPSFSALVDLEFVSLEVAELCS